MGLDTLIDRLNGQVIDQDFLNLLNRVFQGSFVGRDGTGAATPDQNLGTLSIPWGTIRAASLFLGGVPIDPGLVTAQLNRIVSGLVRSTSEFPDYLRPAGIGNGNSFTLLGAATDLVFNVNGVESKFTTDEVKAGLTLGPSANHTCQINDIGLIGQDTSRFLGENDTSIPVDFMLSGISGKVGEFVALINLTTDEIMYCKVESTKALTQVKRGFFFNSGGFPIQGSVLNNDDVLQILSLGFIFIDVDGVTIDVTFNNPVIGGKKPTSPTPVDGDYWLDTTVDAWKIHTGGDFETINRTFAGYVCLDDVDAIGARPEYFTKSYSDENTLTVNVETADIVESHQAEFLISIDGSLILFDFSLFDWDALTDFEAGVPRVAGNNYWLYITELGEPIISSLKPYDNRGFLKGWYHPYNSWRAVAQILNNAVDAFEIVNESDKTLLTITGQLFKTGRVILSNNSSDSDHDIDFAGNLITFDNGRGQVISPNFTKQLDFNFQQGGDAVNNNAGMLDTGTIAASTTYNCFVITNKITGAVDYLASLSFTNPTLPTDFTEKKFIGSLLTDASANILGFTQHDRKFILDLNLSSLNFNGLAPIIRTETFLFVPTGRKVRGIITVTLVRSSGSGDSAVRFTDPDSPDQAPSAVIFDGNNFLLSGANHTTALSLYMQVQTNIIREISFRFNNDDAYARIGINTKGWVDDDLE